MLLMRLGLNTTKQTEKGTDFTDYPIVTRSLLIFINLFPLLTFLTELGIQTPDPLCQRLSL